ncbi:MAG: site-specific DNA-methyltransferase, partial [Thermodesulfobacteriota bacterium]|nr:site-specific DNA-methyltransferase [Thermodesulfobacteriota bacterium]
DPPYNTEKDRSEGRFLYKNSFSSSSWICMMENRYQALISLLADTGVLFSSIGEEENKSLDFLLSQIFGNENKISIATREMKKGANRGTHFSPAIDYVSAYAKNKEFLKPFFEPFSQAYIASFRMDDNDNRGKYKTTNLYEPTLDYYENCRYPIECPDGSIVITPEKKSFSHNKESFQELLIDNKIVFSKGKSSKLQTIDGNKTFWTVKRKIYLSDMEEKGRRPSDLILNLINGNGTKEMTALGMQFSFAKPVALIKYLIKIINFRDSYILDYFAGSGTTGHAVINLNREDGGKRKYILVEMGDYFDTVLKPRISKVVYSENWKDGKPTTRHTGISHCFKCIRLESYEDALNNLRFEENETRDAAIAGNSGLREDYMLHYILDVETRGSQSLLNIDSFADPTAYTLKIKKPGSDEHVIRNVDLIETFNYLIGLRVTYIDAPQIFTARFKRELDPDLPEDQETRLVVDGKMKLITDDSSLTTENWWFRKIEGWVPADPNNLNNGHKEKILIVWRKLTGDMEKDNIMLDEWFKGNRISTRDFEFDTIYVNGSNNLPNLKLEGDTWKVRLIEENFMKRMWDVEGV